MTTQKISLQCIAKSIKAIDSIGINNVLLEDKEKIQAARSRLINVLFRNGYELQYNTYRLIKSKVKRDLTIETN